MREGGPGRGAAAVRVSPPEKPHPLGFPLLRRPLVLVPPVCKQPSDFSMSAVWARKILS